MTIKPLNPTQKKKVRAAGSNYCERAEVARLKWDYSLMRRFYGFGVPPEDEHKNDCSGYVSLTFNWSMHETGIYLLDPLNEKYSGIGNTTTQLAFLKAHPAPVDKYLPLDMAIFGSEWDTVHTSICRRAGTAKTAIFSSNGHQNWVFALDAPEPISLDTEKARQNLVGVYRHPQLI